jgi:hypothetical protein
VGERVREYAGYLVHDSFILLWKQVTAVLNISLPFEIKRKSNSVNVLWDATPYNLIDMPDFF